MASTSSNVSVCSVAKVHENFSVIKTLLLCCCTTFVWIKLFEPQLFSRKSNRRCVCFSLSFPLFSNKETAAPTFISHFNNGLVDVLRAIYSQLMISFVCFQIDSNYMRYFRKIDLICSNLSKKRTPSLSPFIFRLFRLLFYRDFKFSTSWIMKSIHNAKTWPINTAHMNMMHGFGKCDCIPCCNWLAACD